MKLKNTHLAALTCASLLGSATLSQAALTLGDIISVNFASSEINGNDYGTTTSGAAVVGSGSDVWNNLTGTGTYANPGGLLELTTNVTSTVGLNIDAGTYNGSNSAGTTLGVFKGNIYISNHPDYGTSPNSGIITLTGLGAGQLVDLYLYAGAGHTAGEGATFNFGITKTATDSAAQETAYVENSNYVKCTQLGG